MTKKLHVKGFTIIELIVVMAIIGVLLGVLGPNMLAYYRMSRIKDANSNAKMVYQAAQTQVSKYRTKDIAGTTDSPFGTNTVIYISYDKDTGIKWSTAGNGLETLDSEDSSASYIQAVVENININVDDADQTEWAIVVDGYTVKGCVSADATTAYYVGWYSCDKEQADTSAKSEKTYANMITSKLAELKTLYDTSTSVMVATES